MALASLPLLLSSDACPLAALKDCIFPWLLLRGGALVLSAPPCQPLLNQGLTYEVLKNIIFRKWAVYLILNH